MFNNNFIVLANAIVIIYIASRVITTGNITEPIRKYFLTNNSYFLHYLFQCKFCVTFHLSWIFTLIYYITTGFYLNFLMIFIIVMFLHSIIKDNA